ncbi:MAG: hypothetical protein Q6354_07240, partial [Candidatus Brocadiales bacterium]|nr:hypothetical protein [Candidatus Brocadiales bacterium]
RNLFLRKKNKHPSKFLRHPSNTPRKALSKASRPLYIFLLFCNPLNDRILLKGFYIDSLGKKGHNCVLSFREDNSNLDQGRGGRCQYRG